MVLSWAYGLVKRKWFSEENVYVNGRITRVGNDWERSRTVTDSEVIVKLIEYRDWFKTDSDLYIALDKAIEVLKERQTKKMRIDERQSAYNL